MTSIKVFFIRHKFSHFLLQCGIFLFIVFKSQLRLSKQPDTHFKKTGWNLMGWISSALRHRVTSQGQYVSPQVSDRKWTRGTSPTDTVKPPLLMRKGRNTCTKTGLTFSDINIRDVPSSDTLLLRRKRLNRRPVMLKKRRTRPCRHTLVWGYSFNLHLNEALWSYHAQAQSCPL